MNKQVVIHQYHRHHYFRVASRGTNYKIRAPAWYTLIPWGTSLQWGRGWNLWSRAWTSKLGKGWKPHHAPVADLGITHGALVLCLLNHAACQQAHMQSTKNVLKVIPNVLLLGIPENQQPFGQSFFFSVSFCLCILRMRMAFLFVCSLRLMPSILSRKLESCSSS